MRVTFSMTYQKMILNLNRKAEDADRLSSMIASGKLLSKPEEDPLAWAQSMDLKQGLREVETFQKNVDFAVNWTQATVDTLTAVSDLLDEAIKIGLAGKTSVDDQTLKVDTIETVTQQVRDLANTQYQDCYLFSGSKLTTAPFDGSSAYQGDTSDFEVRVGKNNLQAINLNGQSVFIQDAADPVGTNIMNQLSALKTALEGGDPAAIQTATTALQNAQKHVREQSSMAGLRSAYFGDQKSSLGSLKLNGANQLSELEDANMAEAITQLQQNQTSLEAALQVTAMLKDLSLAKYL
jgi:flagellar hook-associated protein 3 FlgL